MAQTAFFSTLVLASCVSTSACSQSIEERGAEALARHDYNAAISLALPKAEAGEGEYQFAVGYFLLSWLEDSEAKTRPAHSYDDALQWIYKAIDQQVPQAVSTIRVGYEFGRYSLPKNAELARCWGDVEDQPQARDRCYRLETERGVGRAMLN